MFANHRRLRGRANWCGRFATVKLNGADGIPRNYPADSFVFGVSGAGWELTRPLCSLPIVCDGNKARGSLQFQNYTS